MNHGIWKLAVAAFVVATLNIATTGEAAKKPLKVFILAGQSNMQGHANISTFPHIGMDPETVPMLKDMTDDDGNPITLDKVWISEIGSGPNPEEERHGILTAGYGVAKGGPKIDPEYTFGIYMAKHLDEPILIIKTAWGGKSLNTDFRPPSAGPYDNWANPDKVDPEKKKQRQEASGAYYRKIMEHVKKVLADPGRVCPAYDKDTSYEIAGFVWFQGWNDMVDRDTYPNRNKIDGYALYTELMAKFIKDVRKDLNAPKMPFVIGVLGVGGRGTPENEAAREPRYRGIKPAIEKAMSDPARMPEFKGNVAAVFTGDYWDHELDDALTKYDQKVKGGIKDREKQGKLSREERDALHDQLMQQELTERERELLSGRSNFGFHYHGSAKILGGIGKGFAEAMLELMGESAK